MPNVSRKRLLRSIRGEKDHRRTGSDAGMPAQERRMQHQAHLQNHGPALLHHARLAMAHAGGRYPLQARQGTGPTRVQDTQEGIQGCQALGEEGAERFQIRVGLVAAEYVDQDDQGAFRAGMQRAHASQVVAQEQALVEKIQARTVQDSLQKRANGVQAKGRRAGVPDARGRIRRVYRRRGCNPDATESKLWMEAHGWTGDEQDHVFNKIDPDVWRNVRRPTHHQGSRLCKLGDVPRIPGMRSAGIIQNSTWYWTTRPATSQKLFGSTWNLQETTSPLSFSPRTRRSSIRLRLRGGISRDGWPAGISGLLTS